MIALLIFALCTALIVAMKSEFDLYYQRGANVFISEQVYAYLRGAEDLASLALIQDYDSDRELDQPRDELTEPWAQDPDTVVPYDLDEGGWLRGGLSDLQGRFNINALVEKTTIGGRVANTVRYTAAQQQFIRLLLAQESLQLGEQDAILITESIGDWLDEDSQPRPNGAEDDYYVGQTPAYRAANALMVSVSELRAVAYVTPQIYDALRPFVAVLPDPASLLNILTATPMVLRTINTDNILAPLSEADGLALEETRRNEGFGDVEDFLKHPVLEGKTLLGIKPRLGLSTSYFLLSAEAKVADRKLRLYSVLERRNRSVLAIARSSEGLCPTEQIEGKFCKTAP
ncbi:MAG: type II secretion system minor pseudopilin GspK [Proteobacteria bacterium]|nr:type II secretion system minor pseudopilin GspK [Pseudomonadota bacterium]